MLKASPSGADKIQSFPDLRQMLLYAALGGIVLAALFAPWLTDVSPLDQDLMNLDQPFSPATPWGPTVWEETYWRGSFMGQELRWRSRWAAPSSPFSSVPASA